MIDLHSHILPGVDDGASDLDVSIAMLDAAVQIGYRAIVTTPHLTGPLTPAYAEAVARAFEMVRPLAEERGIELIRGYEIRLTPDLPARLRAGEPITLGGGSAVLVDLPAGEWPWDLDEALYNIQMSGFQPVLAHPERYADVQRRPRYGRELAERGVALQVTIGSFSGIFGRRAQRAAEALLREGAVHVAATDGHSTGSRLEAVPAGLRRLEELVDRENGYRILNENPSRLLHRGEVVSPARAAVPAGVFGRFLDRLTRA